MSAAPDDDFLVLGEPAGDPDRERSGNEDGDEEVTFLLLQLGGLRYAFPALAVQEVAEAQEPIPVPQAPTFVRGVFPLGGRVVVLLELRALLGLAPPVGAPSGEGRTLVVTTDAGPMGLRVDAVLGLHAVPRGRLRSAGAEDGGPVVETFFGDGQVVSVLDVQRLVALAEARVGKG